MAAVKEWDGDAKIGRATESLPLSTLNNGVVSGTFNVAEDLLSNEIEIKNLSPILITQKLVQGVGLWIECPTATDTISPGNSKEVPVKFRATLADTMLETNIRIVSNDLEKPKISLPA